MAAAKGTAFVVRVYVTDDKHMDKLVATKNVRQFDAQDAARAAVNTVAKGSVSVIGTHAITSGGYPACSLYVTADKGKTIYHAIAEVKLK